jgi:glycosyltransferase involved in cell wall biosynthesis
VKTDQWPTVAENFDIIVGTIFTSIDLVQDVVARVDSIRPAYYVQDYEPLFHEPGSQSWAKSIQSYTLLKDAVLFAKTDWIRLKVLEEHGVLPRKVSPSLDHKVYYSLPRKTDSPITISAMIRPKTPRRGALRTMRILSSVKEEFGDSVEVKIFGVSPQDSFFDEAEFSAFDYENYGVLSRPDVADLLRDSDVFVDFSDYQAFGRTALEALSSGCVAIVPKWGGVGEFSWSEACFEVDPFDEVGATEFVIKELATRGRLGIRRLSKKGTEASKVFSINRAAQSEVNIFVSMISA